MGMTSMHVNNLRQPRKGLIDNPPILFFGLTHTTQDGELQLIDFRSGLGLPGLNFVSELEAD